MAKDEAKWSYWTKQIKEWQASGLSRNAYCKREGLKPTTFDYWRPLIVANHAEVETMRQVASSSDITLVPVAVDPPRENILSETMALGQPLKLKSPYGWEMQLPSQVDSNWLIAVLRQLP